MLDKTYNSNQIISSLPERVREALIANFRPIEFSRGTVLTEVGQQLENVLFPDSGVITYSMSTVGGKFIGVGLVGREGIVGAMLGFGYISPYLRLVAASAAVGRAVSARNFRRIVAEHFEVRQACIRHNEFLLKQARLFAVCNISHPSELRVASRLLQFADRLPDQTIPLTQSDIAEMLGVRRTTVTDAANFLESQGAISYSRGSIKILNRRALERLACDCYERIKTHHQMTTNLTTVID